MSDVDPTRSINKSECPQYDATEKKDLERLTSATMVLETSPVAQLASGKTVDIRKELSKFGYKNAMALADEKEIQKMVALCTEGDRRLAVGTWTGYIETINWLCRHWDISFRELVAKLKIADLRRFIDCVDKEMEARGVSPSRRNSIFCAIKKLCETIGLKKAKKIHKQFSKKVHFKTRIPNDDEMRRILLACENPIDKLIILLPAECFQRPNVIPKLTWRDIQPHIEDVKNGREFLVFVKEDKEDTDHHVPISRATAMAIKQRIEEIQCAKVKTTLNDPIVPLGLTRIKARGREIMERAGVSKTLLTSNGTGTRYSLRYYDLRHRARTIAIVDRNGNSAVINYFMGHSANDPYLKLIAVSDEKLLSEFRKSCPRIINDENAVDVLVDMVVDRSKELGLPITSNVLAELKRLLGGARPVHRELGESCASLESEGEWSRIAETILDKEFK